MTDPLADIFFLNGWLTHQNGWLTILLASRYLNGWLAAISKSMAYRLITAETLDM